MAISTDLQDLARQQWAVAKTLAMAQHLAVYSLSNHQPRG